VKIHGLYFTRIDFPTPVIASDLQAAILSESEVIKLIERNATVFRAETETLRREVIYCSYEQLTHLRFICASGAHYA
jgi:hypothetical protein